MDRLIREMSYLFTKQRFMELRERAHEIAMSNSEHPNVLDSLSTPLMNFWRGYRITFFTMKSPLCITW